jgi:hypothetical protein
MSKGHESRAVQEKISTKFAMLLFALFLTACERQECRELIRNERFLQLKSNDPSTWIAPIGPAYGKAESCLFDKYKNFVRDRTDSPDVIAQSTLDACRAEIFEANQTWFEEMGVARDEAFESQMRGGIRELVVARRAACH